MIRFRCAPAPIEDAIPALVDKCFDRAQQVLDSIETKAPLSGQQAIESQNSAIRFELSRHARTTFQDAWVYECLFALAEYFQGDAAARLIDARRNFLAVQSATEVAIRKYVRHAEHLASLELPGVRVNAGQVQRMARAVEFGMAVRVKKNAFPLFRLDARSSERLFVFRMWTANKRQTGKPRIEAIAEIMGIDGFRHQYDRRTIERLCADFPGKNRLK